MQQSGAQLLDCMLEASSGGFEVLFVILVGVGDAITMFQLSVKSFS